MEMSDVYPRAISLAISLTISLAISLAIPRAISLAIIAYHTEPIIELDIDK